MKALTLSERGESMKTKSTLGARYLLGLIFVVQQAGYVGVYGIEENGDVPPKFTVGGPKGILQKPRGLDLDPKHNAVIVSDKGLNAVMTFEVPQIFKASTSSPGGR